MRRVVKSEGEKVKERERGEGGGGARVRAKMAREKGTLNRAWKRVGI